MDLAGLDASDCRQLGVVQDAASQIVDEMSVEAGGRGCLGCVHDICIIPEDSTLNYVLNDTL